MALRKDLIVVTAAMLKGSELEEIQKLFPMRIYDVGIAEEHAITMATGIALAGKKPIISIYSTFLQRGYDQILHDAVRQNANMIIAVDRAGITGPDGDTHQGIFDVSFLRSMPNIVITQGIDEFEMAALLDVGLDYNGTFVIRYPKQNITEQKKTIKKIKFGS